MRILQVNHTQRHGRRRRRRKSRRGEGLMKRRSRREFNLI
jgi:hypothetical protein